MYWKEFLSMNHLIEDIMNTICIVACGKKKIWDNNASAGPVISKDMYTGLFTRKCIQYAEKFHKDSYCILSAKYGFISPEEIVEGPYNECYHIKKTNPIKENQLLIQIEKGKLNKHEKIII